MNPDETVWMAKIGVGDRQNFPGSTSEALGLRATFP
jgi:hypothetical protein